MSQRTALLVTTALTVFVMVMLSGIAWQVFQKTSLGTQALQSTAAPQANAVTQPAVAQPAEAPAAADPVTPQQAADREAAFQQLVQQANTRLDQAYKQQQALTKEIEDQKAAAQTRAAVPQQPIYKVTPEQALAIALATVPGSNALKPAELVSFHDLPTYEVTLDKGMVYVDANSGEVVYNSAAVIVVRNGSGGGGNGGGNAPASTSSAPSSGNKGGGEKEDHSDDHKQDSNGGEQEHGD